MFLFLKILMLTLLQEFPLPPLYNKYAACKKNHFETMKLKNYFFTLTKNKVKQNNSSDT